MAADTELRHLFQRSLRNLKEDSQHNTTLTHIKRSLENAQQLLAIEGVHCSFSFKHSDVIDPTIEPGLVEIASTILERHVQKQCGITFTIDGEQHHLALARFKDVHYTKTVDYIGNYSYESRRKTTEETYEAVLSNGQVFRFDQNDKENPLKTLTVALIQRAAKQKFLQAYNSKNVPRRIKRTLQNTCHS